MSSHRRGRRGGAHAAEHSSDERWLLTYADMITLLMALFMVLFSISSVNISKYQVLQHALQKAFMGGVLTGGHGIQQGNPTRIQGVQTTTPSGSVDSSSTIFAAKLFGKIGTPAALSGGGRAAQHEQDELQRLQQQIEQYAVRHGFSSQLQTSIDQRGLVIRLLTDKVLFANNQAVVQPQAMPLLREVATLLVRSGIARSHAIRVEGNTDNRPAAAPWQSNWELSSARADAVLEVLLENRVPPRRLSASGFADENPIAPNTSADGRELNRRVDIVIVRAHSTSGDS